MLVLTRELGDSIIINETIKITVVRLMGDKVRLGIDAPRDISVHRQEVYEAIQAENKRLAIEGKAPIDYRNLPRSN